MTVDCNCDSLYAAHRGRRTGSYGFAAPTSAALTRRLTLAPVTHRRAAYTIFDMKQRLLVMNGQRLLQSETAGQWVTSSVAKAGHIRPGIYNLFSARAADTSRKTEGPILHADDDKVYQLAAGAVVAHARSMFQEEPQPGKALTIAYEGDAIATSPDLGRGQGLSL